VTEWDSNWILVEDHYYLMKVTLYDKDKHPIFMTPNVVLKNVFDNEFFEIVKSSKLNSELILRTKKSTGKN